MSRGNSWPHPGLRGRPRFYPASATFWASGSLTWGLRGLVPNTGSPPSLPPSSVRCVCGCMTGIRESPATSTLRVHQGKQCSAHQHSLHLPPSSELLTY